jgi:hypothetical protein
VRNLLFRRSHHETRLPHPSRTLRRVGFHNPVPLRIRKAPRPGRPRLQSCHQPIMIIKFVIPNRAESPVRNLLSADTTTKEAAPFFAHFAKSGIPQPHPSEDLESATTGKATTSVVPQALSKSCHSERRKIIRKADDLAESRNLLSADTTPNEGGPFFAHLCEGACPERSRRVGFHNPIPLRTRQAPRPGRPRLQSCRRLETMIVLA